MGLRIFELPAVGLPEFNQHLPGTARGETQVCERRAESGERGAEFGERRAEIFGINFDKKWMYYRGIRVY